MTHTRTPRDLAFHPKTRTVRLDRGGRNYLIAGRVAAAAGYIEIAVCAVAVYKGWLTFESRALPLLTALLVLLAILSWVFPHRADQIDGTYTVAEDLGPAGGVEVTVDDVLALKRAGCRAVGCSGEGSGEPLAVEGAAR